MGIASSSLFLFRIYTKKILTRPLYIYILSKVNYRLYVNRGVYTTRRAPVLLYIHDEKNKIKSFARNFKSHDVN